MDSFISAAHQAIAALEESIEFNAVPDWSPSIERRRQAIRALQRVMQSGCVPPGWHLVPAQPTAAMQQAHDDAWRAVDRCWAPLPATTRQAWQQMLRVAPLPMVSPAASAAVSPGVSTPAALDAAARNPDPRVIVRRVQASLVRLG